MASFDIAVEGVLQNEGGYVNNLSDPGGETNFGITKKNYPNVDIPHLTRDDAKFYYKRDYWFLDGLEDQPVANKLFDMVVNMGRSKAITLLQRGLVSRFLWVKDVKVDGLWGAATFKAVNDAHTEDLLNELRAQSVLFYAVLAVNPSKRQFLLGWLRRACQ
jgi:lysozyme family protein